MLNRTGILALVGLASVALTPLGVSAEEAPKAVQAAKPAAAPTWSDAHMRSNFSKPGGPVTRPPIQGASGYGALAAGTSETRMAVPETLESATQRDWEQGPLNATTTERTRQRITRPTGVSRGSSIRSEAKSSRGRRR